VAATAAAGLLASGLVAGLAAPAGAAPADTTPPPTSTTQAQSQDAAVAWIEAELGANAGALPFGFDPSQTDWGLTLDAVLALEVTGHGADAAATTALDALAGHLDDYLTGTAFGDPGVYAGSVGKTLLAVELAGRDARAFGGHDLEDLSRAAMQTSGTHEGRFSNQGSISPDFSNGFVQALNVMALSHTDGGVPAEAADFLYAQQCPGGGFRLDYDTVPTRGCESDDQADTDTTGLAVQALLTLPATTQRAGALEAATGWLLEQQHADGGFGGTGSGGATNTNSTGPVAQALAAAGEDDAAAVATDYVRSQQLTAEVVTGTPAAAEAGAIAYDDDARSAALDTGIAPTGRDQLRRSTFQGVLALGAPSFGAVVEVPHDVVALVPARLVDTRTGGETIDGVGSGTGQVAVDGTMVVAVAGRGGVPDDASAAVLTVTAVDAGGAGHVRVWPCDQPRPNASSLNFTTGATVAGTVVTGLAANGTACVYLGGAAADVVVDAAGYLPSDTRYDALAPARLLDTRTGGTTVDGEHAATGTVAVDGTVELPVAGRAGVAADAVAVVVTVTADGAAGAGHVRVFPCDAPRPDASNLNFTTGAAVANTVVTPLSADGTVCLYVGGSATDLIVDVAGAFPAGTRYEGLVPARLLDTRAGAAVVDGDSPHTGAVAADGVVELPVAGRGGVPADASTVVLNVTAVDAAGAGHVRVWDCDDARPLASNLNVAAGATVANTVVAGVSDEGTVCLYVGGSATDLVVDVEGALV
jgi:hypothetical protein